MKPGFGKVHLSCAVRCISGGIPPILVTPEEDGSRSYYFLTGRMGQSVNEKLLAYVGFPITISGVAKQVQDWDVLEIGEDAVTIARNVDFNTIFDNCEPDGQWQLAELGLD